MRICRLIMSCLLLVAACAFVPRAVAQTPARSELARDVQRLIDEPDTTPVELYESVGERLALDANIAHEFLLPKLRNPQASEPELVICVWALGHAHTVAAVDDIITVSNGPAKQSERLTVACQRCLASLGGPKAGAFLMERLDAAAGADARFELLNLLGQMQYEPALPKAGELLKVDPSEYYWQPIFVFGKMGDVGVPYLIGRIEDADSDVRINSIMLLGIWLMAPEASRPLQARFWKEPDPEIRRLILSALERTLTDLDELNRFALEVIAKEQDADVRGFAQETIDQIPALRQKLSPASAPATDGSAELDAEYEGLYRTAGKTGMLTSLATRCRASDEPRLKKLRERILQRDSDEAFYDYQKLNEIILNNRRVQYALATQPASMPARP